MIASRNYSSNAVADFQNNETIIKINYYLYESSKFIVLLDRVTTIDNISRARIVMQELNAEMI